MSVLKTAMPFRVSTSLLHTKFPTYSEASMAPVEQEEKEAKPARFDAISTLEGNTQRALQKIFKYQTMSTVQEAVLTRLPNQDDMFVKAKTGTGKTLAFLIAAIETAAKASNPKHYEGASIMVISPTRELANQIAEEAQKLCSFYPYRVHSFVGGDSKRRQVERIQRQRCDIVVATPGRLYDMLTSVPHFKKMCQNIKVLVLDEADQLLDMGFKKELQDILGEIPEKRQTMLFSATVSPEIRRNLGDFALTPDYKLIDTVGENEVNTHMHVKQSAVIAPYKDQFSLIRNQLETEYKDDKVIVFLPTTKSTMLYAQLYKQLMPRRNIFELHSKKAQDVRSRIADRFRKAGSGAILFTSDVSARGVDYPGVSLVMQVGMPSSREQYIHRLGRTGRAGNDGKGTIFLAPFEENFVKHEIKDLPVEIEKPDILPESADEDTSLALQQFGQTMDEEFVREVYTAYLGYFSGKLPQLGLRRSQTIKEAAGFMEALNVTELPYLSPRFLTQLGLADKGGSRDRGNDRRSSYGRNDRSSRSFDRNDRPSRSFDRNDRPSRSFDRNDRSSSYDRSDRPPRSFDRSRSFGDRESSSGGERRRFSNDRNGRRDRNSWDRR
ncbi:P-loop containing nucleoside triphosphate hydrolase protein [Sporodiniella umbellata]|nr:P-loop containing nucleoside triphosphate hydrolase protein [Sporodiniella umbellata]